MLEANVRLWHIADVPLALTNVCFEGTNGHDAGATSFPHMTHSGLSLFQSRIRAGSGAEAICVMQEALSSLFVETLKVRC